MADLFGRTVFVLVCGAEGISYELFRNVVWEELWLATGVGDDDVDGMPGYVASIGSATKGERSPHAPVIELEWETKAARDIESELGVTTEVVGNLDLFEPGIELN